jgi:hypothetical protein
MASPKSDSTTKPSRGRRRIRKGATISKLANPAPRRMNVDPANISTQAAMTSHPLRSAAGWPVSGRPASWAVITTSAG